MTHDNYASSCVATATHLLEKYRYLLNMPDVPRVERRGKATAPKTLREIFSLFYDSKLSKLQIAAKLDVNYNTVARALARKSVEAKRVPKHKNEP